MRRLPRLPQATNTLPGLPPQAQLHLPATCVDPCNVAYLGYQTQDFSPDSLRSSPFAEYNENCLTCLIDNNLEPTVWLDGFGDFLIYFARLKSCPARSSPCDDLGIAGENLCCPTDHLCIIDLNNVTVAQCCQGSSCGSPCGSTAYQCDYTSMIEDTPTVIPACCPRLTSRSLAPTNTIPMSWLVMSTTRAVVPVSGVGMDSITTVTTLTAFVELLVTRADWTGFDNVSSTSRLSSQSTSTGASVDGHSSSEGAGSTPGWRLIVSATIGTVAGLALLVGIYLVFRRSRKRAKREQDVVWTGKPELHAESVPNPPHPPQELDARPRPAQELVAEGSGPRQEGGPEQSDVTSECHRMVEMAAKEVPALEMDVKGGYCEMEVKDKERKTQTSEFM